MSNLCPKCAGPLDANHYCTQCDNKAVVYEQILIGSKTLYNQGLKKAEVRDMSAAIELLNRSVKLNKYNTDARNLLGLVYLEIGETVPALRQWVISKNLKASDNEALYFLKQVQDNPSYLDKLDNAIKKYNQALAYVHQNSHDLAVIQLKKVVSLNPKFVKAYLLLALCYIKEGHTDKAQKILAKVLKIDTSNYVAHKYMYSLHEDAVTGEDFEEEVKENAKKVSLMPRPLNTKVSNALFQFVAMAVGAVVGLSIMGFMVMPGRLEEKNSTINEMSAQMTEADSTIKTLEEEVASLETSIATVTQAGNVAAEDAKEQEDALQETLKILAAANLMVDGNDSESAMQLYAVDAALLSADANAIYESMKDKVYPEVARSAHNSGYTAYSYNRFEEAIELLSTSFRYVKDADYSSRSLYFIARSYQKMGDTATAVTYFQQVVDEYPDSGYADDAAYFIGQLQ